MGYGCVMIALPKTRLTVDEYLAWAEQQPGRFELLDGAVIAMSPEGAGHAERKAAVHAALLAAIRARGLACHALPDGMTVRIDERTAYEPDALVYCGTKLQPSAVEVPRPIVVVEVLSPSTRHIDLSAKLADYFRPPNIAHYLIVDPEGRASFIMRVQSTTRSSHVSSTKGRSGSIRPGWRCRWPTSTQTRHHPPARARAG
jgi:Uma2 family endonuclease